MPEGTQVAGDVASQTAPAKPPAELEVKVRGKKVMIPIDRAVTLVQQAMNQESTAMQLKAERAALESDGARYAEYEAYVKYLADRPVTARAVQAAIANPEAVLNPPTAASIDPDDPDAGLLGTHRQADVSNEVRDELAALRTQLAELAAVNQSRSSLEAENLARSAIENEANSYPWLKSDTVRPLALDRIRSIRAADPHVSVAAATATAADEFRELIQAEQTTRVEKAKARQQLKVERPDRWTPDLSVKTPMTKKDLEDGTVLKLAKEAARAFGLPVT